MKKSQPPGWSPHQVTSRIDGWICDPANEDRIPAAVASMIVQNMPSVGGDTIADIKARMIGRQRALEHRRKRQRAIINRMAMVRRG
jgi:hypothetical protein